MGLAFGCASSSALAQLIPPSEQPGREQQRFQQPIAPRAQPGPAISLPSTVAPLGAANTSLVVHDIRISGSTVYGTKDFLPLYQELLGKTGTVQAIYDLARKITAKYGNDGYVLSRAIVPPQQFNAKSAVIRIQIIEG